MLYHDRYSASFLHVCCIGFDTVYPNDIHIIRYGFVSVLETIRARVNLKNIASMPTSTSEKENNELVMLFFPPSSQPFGSRLPRGCGLAPEGLWAGSFGVLSLPVWDVWLSRLWCWAEPFWMLSRPVLNVELASLNCWAEKLFTTTGWHVHSSRWCSFRFLLLCLDSGSADISGYPIRTNRNIRWPEITLVQCRLYVKKEKGCSAIYHCWTANMQILFK